MSQIITDQILEKIKDAPRITIFRHVFADWDAIGSQMGLYQWIKDTFPEKEVYVLGKDHAFEMDELEDDKVADSLAIILDTSNAERVEDQRYKLAKDSIRFDHHVFVEPVADLELIDTPAASTTEILARFIKKSGYPISKEAAQYLYKGLISDSVGFSIQSVSPRTFEAAAFLVENGADVVEADLDIFGSNFDNFAYENRIRQNAFRKNDFLYSVMSCQDYLQCGTTFSKAKEKVFILSGFKQIKNWALFTEAPDGTYQCSLRSRKLLVRDIAEEYDGGGHDQAAGIKGLNVEDVEEIIRKMAERSLEVPEEETVIEEVED